MSDPDCISGACLSQSRPFSLLRRALLVGLALAARPAAAAAPLTLKLGAAGDADGFVAYAEAVADAVKWANPSIALKAERTAGSIETVALLQDGRLDVGLVSGEVAYPLFNPTSGPPTDLRVVSVGFSNPGMFAVRADSRYRTVSELKGRPVVWTVRGSPTAVQARFMLEPLGLDPDRDFEAIYTRRMTDGVDSILDGSASALWGVGKRWAGFVSVANDPRGARFLGPAPEEVRTIVKHFRFLHRIVVPAGRYRRQFEPVATVGSWSYLLAGPQVSEEGGYALAAALHRIEGVSASLAGGILSDSTIGNTLQALPRPGSLQVGVERYLREVSAIN